MECLAQKARALLLNILLPQGGKQLGESRPAIGPLPGAAGGRGGRRRGSHKRLLYCVNVNRTSLDHLPLGVGADIDEMSHDASIAPRTERGRSFLRDHPSFCKKKGRKNGLRDKRCPLQRAGLGGSGCGGSFAEGQQVRVDLVGLSGGHAVQRYV